jgi:serine/threonine protein kinase
MSKIKEKIFISFVIVMDFASFGEVLKWDSKSLQFRPYNGKVFLCEKEIKKIMRHCIRGLNYCKIYYK